MPTRVSAFGQRQSLRGFGETPDAFEALYEFPGFLLTWTNSEVSAGRWRGLEIGGTKGTLAINRAGFEVVPDATIQPEDQIPRVEFASRTPVPAPPRTEAIKDEGYEQVRDQFVPHVRNFLASIRSRQAPTSDLASAQRTATACHLANVAMRVGRLLRWDPMANDVVGDAEASALLTKTYRAPWDRELRALVPDAALAPSRGAARHAEVHRD